VSEELQSDARVIRDETAKMTGLVKQLLGFCAPQGADSARRQTWQAPPLG
jgi:hypothetical protein